MHSFKKTLFMASVALVCLTIQPSLERTWAGEVTFYCGTGMPPFVHLEPGGVPGGFAVELLEEIMKEAGEPFSRKEIVVTNWPRALHNMMSLPGSADIFVALIPERVGKIQTVGPIERTPMGIFTSKASGISIHDPAELKKYRIGVVRNTAPISMLMALNPEIESNLEKTPSVKSHMLMLKEGRIDLVVAPIGKGTELLRETGMDPEDYHMVYPLGSVDFYYGFNPTVDSGYVARLQAALGRLIGCQGDSPSRYDRIRAKYIKE